jgi:hypothetical protein
VSHPQIAAFARLAGENTPALRALEGQKTLLSRTMHGLAFDDVHDEIVVTSPLAQAILTFRGGAGGEEAPVRVIQGTRTQIIGDSYSALDKVSVDGVNSEIYLPLGNGASNTERSGSTVLPGILVFDRMANGNVPPKRILKGPNTQIVGNKPPVAVDTQRNLIVINLNNALLIFDRTASGDVPPRRIIRGERSQVRSTGNFRVHPPTGMIVTSCIGEAVCAWSIEDNGDAPPRFKLPVKQLSGYRISGLALVPTHKEILFSVAGWGADDYPPSGIMNAILTFSWPELYE